MEILVIGTGSWGTALSQVLLHNKNNKVYMYGVNEQQLLDLKNQLNTEFFGNYKLPYPYHFITNSLSILAKRSFDYVLLAVPSEVSINVLNDIIKWTKYPIKLINSTKGFINKSTTVISDLLQDKKYDKIVDYTCLMGPGFAQEVVKQEFTVVNILNKNLANAKAVASLFNSEFFVAKPSIYTKTAEIIAAMKNPLAIVCGMLNGLNQSINVLSAFVTLGIQEIIATLKALNLQPELISEYCGIGDIFLTCCSTKSRNFSFGLNIALYETASEANKHYNKTVEGKDACIIVNQLFKEYNIKSVLFTNLLKVINNELTASEFLAKTKTQF